MLNTTQGTVTGVTGTAPVVSSGGAAPDISMAAATDSVNGYPTSTDHTTLTSLSGVAAGVAPTAPVGVPVLAHIAGVDFTTAAVSDIFTVPTGKTFVCIAAYVCPNVVNGGAAKAFNFVIIESGSSGAMTGNTAATTAPPVATKNWMQGNFAAGSSPLFNCAAGNKVQISITAAWTTTTSVSGAVWVFGYYF